jgi:hypothetical protein
MMGMAENRDDEEEKKEEEETEDSEEVPPSDEEQEEQPVHDEDSEPPQDEEESPPFENQEEPIDELSDEEHPPSDDEELEDEINKEELEESKAEMDYAEGEELGLHGVKGYDKDELKREIGGDKEEAKEDQEKILAAIQEERRLLEEERKRLEDKKKEDERKEVKPEPSDHDIQRSQKVKSFSKERRKRKQLRHLRTNLIIGEYILMILLAVALLFSEGVTWDPLYLPIEYSIYLVAIFLLAIKVERRIFRFLNIKYSGTIQRKALGTSHYTNVEMPETIFTALFLAILLIPMTNEFFRVILDIISMDGDVIPFSDNFVLFVTIIVFAGLLISVFWLIFLWNFRNNVIGPEMKKLEEEFVIEDVFLISSSGLLIKHLSRALRPEIDDDILTGMLTAVKEFVKDSFRASADGELDELQYGKLRVLLEYGAEVYLAVVIKGQESPQLRVEMRRILKHVNRRYGAILKDWDGDVGKLRGVGPVMRNLFEVV